MKKNIGYTSLIVFFAFLSGNICNAVEHTVHSKTYGDVTLKCENPTEWDIEFDINEIIPGIEDITIRINADKDILPPEFDVSLEFPQKDMFYLWNAFNEDRNQIGPDWGRHMHTHLATGLPIFALHNGSNRNRFTISTSEIIRDVYTKIGLREEGCNIYAEMVFFKVPEAPINSYQTKIRLDARDIFWSESIKEGVEWMTAEALIQPIMPPDSAFEPLYSTWYQFHQNVNEQDIIDECRRAVDLGMKTLIVDDGWQTDDNNRGYAYCGDWKVSKNRFPDFKSHVKDVQDLGMKYLLWYSVPLMGKRSKNYEKFKDKFLYEDKDKGVLDPRFPEVREFLITTFENAIDDYGLDGFKLDFIDRFNIADTDPAVAENFAGRDIKALPEAVNVLMKDIYSRLEKKKKNVLIEFRQSYMGPAIRQYGNIIRAGDCPGDLRGNRQRITTLRLTSGNTAVHGDMLEWNKDETTENAAKTILSSMYGVVQYSLMLRDLPDEHLRMVKHWFNFLDLHRPTLLHSSFQPYNPEAGYPFITVCSEKERISTIYQDKYIATIEVNKGTNYLINATGKPEIYVELRDTDCSAEIFNTLGEKVGATIIPTGLNKIEVPIAGYIIINQ